MYKKNICLFIIILILNMFFSGCSNKKNNSYKIMDNKQEDVIQIKVDDNKYKEEFIEKDNIIENNKINKEYNTDSVLKNKTDDKQDNKREDVKTYKKGDSGEKIKQIQALINKFNYDIQEDGIFGKKTYRAICDFQARNNLNIDGIVGLSTLEELKKEPTEKTIYKKISSKNVDFNSKESKEKFINENHFDSTTNYFIWVNTNNFQVNIFEGNYHNWVLIQSFKCTVGAPKTPTIKGRYRIGQKGLYFKVRNSSAICKYYTQIKGNYLFHTVILNNKGKIIDGRLGKAISHGCVRLAIKDAKYIYNNIPKDTSIYID